MNNINYNNELILTYKMFKEEEDCNLCYQIQLLQAFNMKNMMTIFYKKI